MRRLIRKQSVEAFVRPFAVLAAFATFVAAAGLDVDRLRSSFLKLSENRSGDRFSAWLAVTARSRAESDKLKLSDVNEFVNRQIAFADDDEAWKQLDYWATPMETLAKAAGDCEDFAIIKYFTLLQAGIPPEQLRLTYVRARIGGPASTIVQAHMVLTYYATPDAEPLILDNLIGTIQPASKRPDLQPVFSFNSQFIFAASPNSTARTTTTRLSRWQDLLQRARLEGFE